MCLGSGALALYAVAEGVVGVCALVIPELIDHFYPGLNRALVAHAFEKVPYYRDVMRERKLGPDDIRGVADRDLTSPDAYAIARAIGTMAIRRGCKPVFALGRDARLPGLDRRQPDLHVHLPDAPGQHPQVLRRRVRP